LVVLEDPPRDPADADATGELVGLLRDGSDVVATVEATGDLWLVLPVAYDEGWSVTVDGEPATVERVDFNRVGVRVGEGRSEVVASYHPPGWTSGLVGAGAGVLACAAMLVGRTRRRAEDGHDDA
jgi:uncharacterized membrane protein YfhO